MRFLFGHQLLTDLSIVVIVIRENAEPTVGDEYEHRSRHDRFHDFGRCGGLEVEVQLKRDELSYIG